MSYSMRVSAAAVSGIAFQLLAVGTLAGPRIVCDEPSFNFGVVRNVDHVEHVFAIRNLGDAELVVSHVRTSCGCTTTHMDRQALPPGSEAPLAARFSLVGRQGPQQKYIYVECNDPTNSQYRLLVSGEVRTDFEVKPPKIYVTRIADDPPTERTVSIVNAMETPLRIIGLETNNLKGATVRVCAVRDGREYQIMVRVGDLSLPPGGRQGGEVIVRTDCASHARISIPVNVMMQEELIVVPREIVLRKGTDSQAAVTRYLLIRPSGDRMLKILGVESPAEGVTVNTTVLRQNQFRIAVSNLAPTADLNGKALRIRVLLWNDKEQEIMVPIRVEEMAPIMPSHD